MQNMSNKIDLLLDCNFLLNKLVFTLHKEKRLYIDLSEELKVMFKSLYNLANFNQVHIIADSMMSSWRKKIYPDYKSTRKKDTNIDWEYVFKVYSDFLESQKNIAKKYKIYRSDGIEADDFIAKIIQRNNKKGISNFIISNDHDIKQFIYYDKSYNTINFMSNEIKSKNQKVFLPYDYKVYLTYNHSLDNSYEMTDIDSLFDMGSQRVDNKAHYIIDKYIQYKNIEVVYSDKSFFIKLVSGDKSDNINSIYSLNGRGIGEKGAEKIYEIYENEYGIPTFKDSDVDNIEIFDNISDCVIEYKKLNNTNFLEITKKVIFNFNLINLKKLPKHIDEQINSIID